MRLFAFIVCCALMALTALRIIHPAARLDYTENEIGAA